MRSAYSKAASSDFVRGKGVSGIAVSSAGKRGLWRMAQFPG